MKLTSGNILRRGRIVIAVVVFALITALFTSVTMAVPSFANFFARIQFLPAALSFSMAIFVVWLIATLVFGRIYCSTVCPLGFLQDIFSALRRGRKYHYKPARNPMRYAWLTVTVCALVGGIAIVPMLIDPYSAYGRIASNILRPAWLFITGNLTARVAIASAAGLIIALLTLAVIATLALRGGRTWCNTVCPVGTTLGLISRYSVFHIDIDPDKCILCRKCEHACKASCIDVTAHTVDSSRCVVCFNCLPGCPNDAIHYTPSSHRLQIPMMQRVATGRNAAPTAMTDTPARSIDRRRFMATGAIVALAPLIMRADRTARSVAAAAGGRRVAANPAVTPPGARDRDKFLDLCTGCGLCVSHCPTGTLRPSTNEYGLNNLLAPTLKYDLAACSYECTRCNNLCPTGALQPLSLREKQSTVIGRAVTIHENCLHCGECATACPRSAIDMNGKMLPIVDSSRCIGCGACQSVCPAYPDKAIYVNGIP